MHKSSLKKNNSDSHRVCFACTTPYQIMNAISIVHSSLLDADIFIFDTFKGFDIVAENLRKENIFKNIYTIPFYSNAGKIKGRIYCTLQFIRAEQYISRFISKRSYYECIYISSQAIPKVVLMRALTKWNPHIKVVIYEDGMGTYVRNGHALNGSDKFQLLQKIFKFKCIPNGRTVFMPRIPDIAPPLGKIENYDIIPMQPMPYNELRETLKRVFGVKGKFRKIEEKVIVFDDLRTTSDEKTSILDECYTQIYNMFPNDSICKPHPRSNYEIKSQIKIYNNTRIPIEILYMEMTDLDKKVVVSVFSTAAFTPFMMFGKSPKLILLYKMLLPENLIREYDSLVNRIKLVYRNEIYTPSSVAEFEKCLIAV